MAWGHGRFRWPRSAEGPGPRATCCLFLCAHEGTEPGNVHHRAAGSGQSSFDGQDREHWWRIVRSGRLGEDASPHHCCVLHGHESYHRAYRGLRAVLPKGTAAHGNWHGRLPCGVDDHAPGCLFGARPGPARSWQHQCQCGYRATRLPACSWTAAWSEFEP